MSKMRLWYEFQTGVKPSPYQAVLQKAKTGDFFTFNIFSFLVHEDFDMFLPLDLRTSFSLGVPDFGQRKAKGKIRYEIKS